MIIKRVTRCKNGRYCVWLQNGQRAFLSEGDLKDYASAVLAILVETGLTVEPPGLSGFWQSYLEKQLGVETVRSAGALG